MKKYITILGLLLAGSLLANADITTTFDRNGNSNPIATELSVNTAGATATLQSLTTTDNKPITSLMFFGALQSETDFFGPASATQGWNATFNYKFENKATVTGITLEVGLFDKSGNWATDSNQFKFNVSLSGGIGQKEETISAQGTSDPIKVYIPFNGAYASLTESNVGNTLGIRVENLKDSSNVTVGLHSIVFHTQAVPEPSAFGLLAGIGALALVASRRRRK